MVILVVKIFSLYEAFGRSPAAGEGVVVETGVATLPSKIKERGVEMGAGPGHRRGIAAGGQGTADSCHLSSFEEEILMREIRRGGKKALNEETFRDLLHDLVTFFPQFSSEVEKLTKIEEILQNLTDCFSGELKSTPFLTQTTSSNSRVSSMPRFAS